MSGFPYIGVHLSGANAAKTSLVAVEQDALAPPKMARLYEKIGSLGSLFSDDRLTTLLSESDAHTTVVVDCPLTLPPCVECQRDRCPGVLSCEDLEVAWMLRASQKGGHTRKRPINPQTLRLSDFIHPSISIGDPTFSSNNASVAARARVLKKRLSGLRFPLHFHETSVKYTLKALAQDLNLTQDIAQQYRRFDQGRAARATWIATFVEAEIALINAEMAARLIQSVESFEAAICSLVAFWIRADRVQKPPTFLKSVGWTYIPSLRASVQSSRPET